MLDCRNRRCRSKTISAGISKQFWRRIPLARLSFDLSPAKKLRYSFLEKHLRRTIQDLESWHATFDPSWFLLTLQNSQGVDRALQRHNTNPASRDISVVVEIRTIIQECLHQARVSDPVFRSDDFVSTRRGLLPQSTVTSSELASDGSPVLLDETTYPTETDKNEAATHVRDLARLLSCSQPSTLGLLNCAGVLRISDSGGAVSQFQYVFSIPPQKAKAPASLRFLLSRPSPSLDVKFNIARSLARGVMAVHSASFVHKNIRPDTVVIFEGLKPREAKAYLVGFERSRPAAAGTTLTGDITFERNLYRHPSRQGTRPEYSYSMQHDIYSLGVCLLEIGLWNSFVEASDLAKPSAILKVTEQLAMRNSLKAAVEIKNILVKMAKTLLPSLVGLQYTDVVLSCLTCLDSEAMNMFATEKDLYDQDGYWSALYSSRKYSQDWRLSRYE